jgi:hypothetical protein
MMSHLPYPRRSLIPEPAAPSSGVDLQSQLEALLDTVWKAEADWRFMDRLDMAMQKRRETP